MASSGWKEFRSRDKKGEVRFDVLEGQFLRTRYKSGDERGMRAYLIVDLVTRREVMIERYEGGSLIEQITLGDSSLPN